MLPARRRRTASEARRSRRFTRRARPADRRGGAAARAEEIRLDARTARTGALDGNVAVRIVREMPNGDLFVASPLTTGPGGTGPGRGEIVVLPDDNRDGVADGIVTYQARTAMRELDTVLASVPEATS